MQSRAKGTSQQLTLLAGMSLLCSLLWTGGAHAQATQADCQCRDPQGQSRALGTVECLHIGGKSQLMRCEMSTNTPYWNPMPDGTPGCPSA